MNTTESDKPGSQQRMVRRFSDKQAELAAKISNDIAEDMDCGESRKTLRMAVSYFADVACLESQRRASAESKLELFRCAKGLMDAALPPTDMSTTDPNNTPDLTAHVGYLQRLIRPSSRHVADQAREMGLKVGDVIVGREGGGDPVNGWWKEQRLTLKYIGEQCCVWKVEWSNKAITEFRDDGESANWTLSCRDWYLVRPNDPSSATRPAESNK
jgi:hypothetical protein